MAWWDGEPGEIFWMEITDRSDLGVDLKAPQTGDNGQPYWSYRLVTDVRAGDIILHYYKPDKAIVACSRAAGEWWEEDIVWASHGTVARSAGVQPYRRPGFRRSLEMFTYLVEPVDLETIRGSEAGLRLAVMSPDGTDRAYFPFALSDKRPVRPQQGYLTKVPKDVVDLFPQLRMTVDEVLDGRVADVGPVNVKGSLSPEGTMTVGAEYRWAAEDAATSHRDPYAVDPSLVDRGVRGHAVTQNALANWLSDRGIAPRSPRPDEPFFDLAWQHDGVTSVAEVKSITASNEEKQLRLGLGQVLRYRHQMSGTRAARAVLAVEKRPSDESWLALAKSLDVSLVWPGRFDLLISG